MLPAPTLNHLNLPARNPAALRAWYRDKLGFEERGRFLWSGGSLLVFVEGEPVDRSEVHFGFRAESLGALIAWTEALRERGVEVGEVEGDERYSRVFLTDPEGNRFELFYEPLP